METTLTNHPITHAIILFGDVHHLISDQTNKMLEQAGLNDLVELDDGSKIKPTAIMDIMPINKYYEQFPNKKSTTHYNQQEHSDPNYFNPQDFRSDRMSRNGLISLMRGLQKAIKEFQDKGRTPNKALALLAKAEDSYKAKYGEYPKI